MQDLRPFSGKDFWWVCRLSSLWLISTACSYTCETDSNSIRFHEIILSVPPALDKQPTVRENLRLKMQQSLVEESLVRYEKELQAATYTILIKIEPIHEVFPEQQSTRPVHIVLKNKRSSERLEATGRGLPLKDWMASVLPGFDEAWHILQQMRILQTASLDRIVQVLSHPEFQLRDHAIQLLAARKDPSVVPVLTTRLKEESEIQLILRIVGALVNIGDPQATKHLIELCKHKDPQFVVQIVYALGSIGGTSAEGYLFTLAHGHPNPYIRKSAKQALKEMKEDKLPIENSNPAKTEGIDNTLGIKDLPETQ